MAREPLRLSPIGSYNPNTGIYATQLLRCEDVGNIRSPDAGEDTSLMVCPPGTFGLMNGGMAAWKSDPYTADNLLNPGKPSNREIYGDLSKPPLQQGGLANYYGVGAGAVKRWFKMRSPGGQVSPRDCVPISVVGRRFYQLEFRRPDGRQGGGLQSRAFLAICLCVDGGLKADPWFTKGGGQRKNIPFMWRENRDDIAGCVRFAESVFNFDEEDLIQPPTGSAWVQMTIEPGENGWGWDLVILYFLPKNGSGSDTRPDWSYLPQRS